MDKENNQDEEKDLLEAKYFVDKIEG